MKVIDITSVPTKNVIEVATHVLENGGLVVYPTETCYGAGVDATNLAAVAKLLAFKGQRGSKAISVAVADKSMAINYVDLNSTAENIYTKFLPGPITVVSQSKSKVAPKLETGHGTLGIRIPAHPLVLNIINNFGRPVTATSANASGVKPPYSLRDFQKYNPHKSQELVDLFLDAGELPKRVPSTIVDTTLLEPLILRQGEIKLEGVGVQTRLSSSESDTHRIAQEILRAYDHLLNSSPLILALQGELGAGKTQFVKGLAQGLGITQNVKSPTFTLIHEYPFDNNMLFHIDTWRLEKGEEIMELGFDNMLKPGNVIAIEWLQKVRPLLNSLEKDYPVLWVSIEPTNKTTRRISYRLA